MTGDGLPQYDRYTREMYGHLDQAEAVEDVSQVPTHTVRFLSLAEYAAERRAVEFVTRPSMAIALAIIADAEVGR